MTTEIPARFPDLEGKVALVTGGSQGIGRATALLLARNGCRVAVSARSADAVERVAGEIRAAGGEALVVTGDATDAAQVAAVHAQVRDALGEVDVLLPYAGGFDHFTPIWETSLEEWEQVVRANLTSTMIKSSKRIAASPGAAPTPS